MHQRPSPRPPVLGTLVVVAALAAVAGTAPAQAGTREASGTREARHATALPPTPSPTPTLPWEGDTTPPTAPGAPEVVRVDGTSVELRWPGSDDEWEVTYTLYDEISGAFLHRTYAPMTQLVDLAPHTEYAVYVTAQDMAGNSAPRSPATRFTTGAATPPTCTVEYRTHRRPGGFVGRVTVRNGTATAVESWRLGWAFVNGEQATRVWGAAVVQLEQGVFVENLPRNAHIEPGGSVTVRFRATGSPQRPAEISLNNRACAFV
ncbi:cellulose binding domain-containing protein [Cellulomonas cellasea]|uniref:Fibronectin type-III domain-containing protein n=2 Tax=Cellulomonas cellasea TaxID=43670 RepID=A0A0A0BAG7_9CELL|nr:cellulose binding domain-containing protein [Cellulomonas cellasea]KGM03107.1 hypothetical protein Q760_09420 [Cellulomonas cellasea DSM 20118]GEA87841.1 hypothetical protein CCE01nite_17900 [Cellulomonas cellasea]